MRKQKKTNIRQNKKQQKEFLRDFDLLAAINRGEKQLYEEAELRKGQNMMMKTYVTNQQGEKFRIGCDLKEFLIFGPGIYLLFKFLKFATIAFAIISVFALTNMIILAQSHPEDNDLTEDSVKKILLKTTLEHSDDGSWKIVVGINYAMAVLMTVFMVFWREKEGSYVIECLHKTSLSSYSTIILKKIPPQYNELEMQVYLTKLYGEISQIYTVRNFGDDMLYYKQMNEILNDYKEERALILQDKSRPSDKLCSLFLEFRNGHFKMKQKIKKDRHYKACFAFIRFRKVEDREKCLEENQRVLPCFDWLQNNHKVEKNEPEDLRERKISIQDRIEENFPESSKKSELEGVKQYEDLEIETCQMEPIGILWENIHLSRSAKIIKIFILIGLMIGVLFLSIILIFLLSSVSMSVSNSKFKDYDVQEIKKLNDSFAQWSYCISLPPQKFYHEQDLCNGYGADYVRLTLLSLMIPLSIAFIKFLLTELMKALVIFRRYAYQIRRIESQATILLVFYFMVTGGLQLIIYLGSKSSSFLEYFTPTIQMVVHPGFSPDKIYLVGDFTPFWYSVAALNIILIGAISFNLSAVGIIIYCSLRKFIFKKIAQKQRIQIQMNRWLEGYELQIEYIYASALTIIFFTLLFGSCIPILYPLAFIAFLVQYWCYKLIFIKFCKKPLLYNHSINKKASNMVFIALIMHCFFAPIFFQAPQLPASDERKSIFQRIFDLWFYFLLLTLIALYATMRKPIILLFKKLWKEKHLGKEINDLKSNKRNGLKKQKNNLQLGEIYNTQTLTNSEKQQNIRERRKFALPTLVRIVQNQAEQNPYSIHENHNYKEALKILYTINNRERTRKSLGLNKDLMKMYEGRSGEKQENRTLMQVIAAVRKDFDLYAKKHPRQKRNPYRASKRKLYEILLKTRNTENKNYTIVPRNNNEVYQALRESGFNVEGYEINQNETEANTGKQFFKEHKSEGLAEVIEESESKETSERQQDRDEINGKNIDEVIMESEKDEEWAPSSTCGRLV